MRRFASFAFLIHWIDLSLRNHVIWRLAYCRGFCFNLIFLIFLQSFVVTLLVLPILKQGGLYITKGIKYFFDE